MHTKIATREGEIRGEKIENKLLKTISAFPRVTIFTRVCFFALSTIPDEGLLVVYRENVSAQL